MTLLVHHSGSELLARALNTRISAFCLLVDLSDVSELCSVYPGLGTACGLKPAPHLADPGLVALQLPRHCPVPRDDK